MSNKSSDPKSITDKLDELEQQLFNKPTDSKEEKIKQVRAAIESGEYEVDPGKIAEKMIDFESKLDN